MGVNFEGAIFAGRMDPRKPRNLNASKIKRYTVYTQTNHKFPDIRGFSKDQINVLELDFTTKMS